MNDTWSVAKVDPGTLETIDIWPMRNEAEAVEAFEKLCANARENGGGYELRKGGTWVTIFTSKGKQ